MPHPATEIIEERSNEDDSSSSSGQRLGAFDEAEVIVRTRDSGEFFFNRDGSKRRSIALPNRSKVTLDEIDEELKDPDF